MDPEIVTPKFIAKQFGVCSKTVTRWARQRRIPYFVTPGGHRRFNWTKIKELYFVEVEADDLPEVSRPIRKAMQRKGNGSTSRKGRG